uniref:Uncharacterized protein n=1 Tax=Anguilla anguilla TaxID=7936 RepID=A0A0E9PYD9_ANGAN
MWKGKWKRSMKRKE